MIISFFEIKYFKSKNSLTSNPQEPNIITKLGWSIEKKKEILSQILGELSRSSSANELSLLLTSIKILAREDTGNDPLYTEKCYNILIKFLESSDQVIIENCLKALINIVYVGQDARALFESFELTTKIIDLCNQKNELLFLCCRLLFILSVVNALSGKQNTELLDFILKIVKKKELHPCMDDCFKTLFNLSYSNVDKDLIDYIFFYIEYGYAVNSSFNMLLNCDHQFVANWLLTNNKVDLMFAVLESSLPNDDKLLPVLLISHSLIRANGQLRSIIRKRLLPSKFDRTVSLDEGNSARSFLIRALEGVNMQLKTIAGQFLFALLKENSNRLVYHIGYGHAAGFLMENGLLGSNGLPNSSTSIGDSSDEEEMNNSDYDPITGQLKKPKEDPLAGMTEEEKDREAEKLFVLMNRLEKNGMIKMMRKE